MRLVKYLAVTLFLQYSLLSAEQTQVIPDSTSNQSQNTQTPSFDYKNITTEEALKLSAEELSSINEEAFSALFGNNDNANNQNQIANTSFNTFNTNSTSSLSGTKSKDKISKLINQQEDINQRILSQTKTKTNLLTLYVEDLFYHQKINFTTSHIVKIEAQNE